MFGKNEEDKIITYFIANSMGSYSTSYLCKKNVLQNEK